MANDRVRWKRMTVLFPSCFPQKRYSARSPQREGGQEMTSVVRRDNESIEDALKRFKRELRKVGVLREARKHEHYEKPSEIKKRKKAASARNRHRRAD